jgi:biotin synthase
VPINHLVQVEGTPLHGLPPLDPFEFVRTIAVARITMPKARVRLSAGRRELGEAVQAMCFMAGANSIFYGDKLLTTDNPEANDDRALLEKLGLRTRGAVLESVQKEAAANPATLKRHDKKLPAISRKERDDVYKNSDRQPW